MSSISIFEFVCGGGLLAKPLSAIPVSWRSEGVAMLQALAADCGRCQGLQVHVAWDERFGLAEIPEVEVHPLQSDLAWLPQWEALAQGTGLSLVIAPETDGCLASITDRLRSGGHVLVNADADFMAACSDKWLTAQALEAHAIPHPPTRLGSDEQSFTRTVVADGDAWIVKPRDGAGCQDTWRIPTAGLEQCREFASDRYLVQPWLEGIPGSLAVLCGPETRVVLPPMRQYLEFLPEDHRERLGYGGGQGPWYPMSAETLERFARGVLDAIPGEPAGWIGIDFLYRPQVAEQPLLAIEINPRLTTSYLGVRECLQQNVAELMLKAWQGHGVSYSLNGQTADFTPFRWKRGPA
jgi:predicted ATP-grasp superfamily ATP-dependent carboligase